MEMRTAAIGWRFLRAEAVRLFAYRKFLFGIQSYHGSQFIYTGKLLGSLKDISKSYVYVIFDLRNIGYFLKDVSYL